MLENKALFKVLEDLEFEYIHALTTGSIPKQSVTLELYENGTPSRYANVMCAVLSTKEFGSKTIYVDERKKHCTSRTLVFDPSGEPLANLCSVHLTRVRCGYMAALCWKWYSESCKLPARVGIIGFGKIGRTVQDVLIALFGSSNTSWVIQPNRHSQFFLETNDGLPKPVTESQLRTCDLVITATSEYDRKYLICADGFRKETLFISFDSGYLLDKSFRQGWCQYSDCPDALLAHRQTEFPWDADPFVLTDLRRLKSHRASNSIDSTPASAYIYGMAFADIIMALNATLLHKEFFLHA